MRRQGRGAMSSVQFQVIIYFIITASNSSALKQISIDCQSWSIKTVILKHLFVSRGKGLGKILMLKTEEYCLARGFRTAYLTTHDQQIFYSRCGYKFSEAVCAFGGSSSLNLGNFARAPSQPALPSKPPTTNGSPITGDPSPPAPPPPPPPPKMPNSPSQTVTSVSSISPDLVALCAKAFAQPSLPASLPLIENIPEIDMNLRNQKNNEEDCNEKMFMKKPLI